MRTADLIGAKVYDSGGREVGKVHDVRAAVDGRHETDAPYVATHLLVAAGSVGTRLGYGYGHMHGPWPLSAIMKRAMARSYAVRWEQIASIEPRLELRLSASRDDLMTMAELVGDGAEA
jgi:PRC-barrel domain